VVGLAASYELARAGHEVQCFEADEPMAARSTGGTRIFRLAHATPALVEWAVRARAGWRVWSRAAGLPLVGQEGTVVSGDIEDIVNAMTAAGAPPRVTERPPPALPAADPVGPFLVDDAGGAIQAAETGRFLLGSVGAVLRRSAVTAIEVRGDAAVVVAGGQSWTCESVLIAAGAATPGLAAQVGIAVPDTLVHHARFTFPLRAPQAAPPCWLDRAEEWRPGLRGYAHLAGPGLLAVGGHLPVEQTRWELGREAVTAASREVVCRYVVEYLSGVLPDVVETLYCNVIAGLHDGISTARSGPVLAVWGNNLFKFAPRLAEVLTRAATELTVPAELAAVRHPG
jgi:sarcosine oxidase